MGLGAMLGGVLYAGLGARRCFAVSASLPSLSLFLIVLPTARRWCKSHGVGGRPRTTGLAPRRRHGGGNGRMYELVGNVSARGSDNDSSLCILNQGWEVEMEHLARGPSKDNIVGARSIPESVNGA